MNTNDARNRYLVSDWGGGYFDVDLDGFATVSPEPGSELCVRLSSMVDELRKRGFRSPFVLRFPQILRDRVNRLHEAFQAAIEEFDYPKHYQGVYPVKVNQQRVVVESLVADSAKHKYGLEVGSKGELVVALAQEIDPEAFIVCNGFKDRDYAELALRAEQSGNKVILICETIHEVQEILDVAKEVQVQPRIGFRARLHSCGAGKWVESGGHHAKFGLTTIEILQCIKILEEADCLSALQCLHYHIGSQISDILSIKEAVKEAARIYCHVKRRAPSLSVIDMGGGLGIDYDGSSTASDWSRNYTLEEYCRDCVYNILSVCQQEDVEPPFLVSESGRAVTAFGTMVVVSPLKIIGRQPKDEDPLIENPCHQIQDLQSALSDMKADNWRELVNDARALHEEVTIGFKMGFVSLEDRAAGEALFSDICNRALGFLNPEEEDAEEVSELQNTVAPMVVCNFSVFQSVPDTWAVRQVFPIMPLSRLTEDELLPYTLGDITCDSDGRIDDFLSAEGSCQKIIPMPPLDLKDPYLIGIFLVGAYQDTLGDYHNLFGAGNEVSVSIDGKDSFSFSQTTRGTSVSEAIAPFGFRIQELVSGFDDQHGGDDSAHTIRYRDCFLRVLSSGTYLRR